MKKLMITREQKKQIRRMCVVALVCVMLVGLIGKIDFVSAADTASIHIQSINGEALGGRKFAIYKLLSAKVSADESSINYTINPQYLNSMKEIVGAKLQKEATLVTEYQIIDYIQSLNTHTTNSMQEEQITEGNTSAYREFVEELRTQIVSDGENDGEVVIPEEVKATSYTLSNLEYGYYLLDEVTDVYGNDTSASLCMVTTAAPKATVVLKSVSAFTSKKVQEDDNRNVLGNQGWNDIADFESGQNVPFKSTAVIPNINGYETYYYAWHDDMAEGLMLDNTSIEVSLRDESGQEPVSYTLKPEEINLIEHNTEEETFQVEIVDVKEIIDREFYQNTEEAERSYGQTIELTYEAVVCSDDTIKSVMGNGGMENRIQVEFSNDPDSDNPESTGRTAWDAVVCYTYGIALEKTNEEQEPLAGVKFRLYRDKELREEVYVKFLDTYEEDGNCYEVMHGDTYENASKLGVEMVTDANGRLTICGVDSDDYFLKETKALPGYRELSEAIEIEIDPFFPEDRNTYVSGTASTTLSEINASVGGREFTGGIYKNNTYDVDDTGGIVSFRVVNTSGRRLPVTGSGMIVVTMTLGMVLMWYAGKKRKSHS